MLLAVAIVVAVPVAAFWLSGSSQAQEIAAPVPDSFLAANAKRKGVVTTASGLQYQVLKAGQGPHPGPQDLTLINYEGRLTNGDMFDSSANSGGPIALSVDGVVPGFAEALQLMPRGAKYRVWLPPQLGYGAEGAGPIPPNSVIVFDIELVDFRSADGAGGATGEPQQ